VGLGLAAIALGGTLWLTAPTSTPKPTATGIRAAPLIAKDRFGFTLRGSF